MSESHHRLAREHVGNRPVRCAILTVSDTRTAADDASGALIGRLLVEAGHAVQAQRIVRDDSDAIAAALEEWAADPAVQTVITTGGTGIGRRDTTIEVMRAVLSKEIEGFGEIFRMLSWHEVGPAAMLSRAIGGVAIRDPARGGDTILFALPGSVNAVQTAMSRLIIPELEHLIWERFR